VIADIAVIPVVYRPGVHAMAHRLKGQLSGWDSTLCLINGWYREA
jgi:hypothetical protein